MVRVCDGSGPLRFDSLRGNFIPASVFAAGGDALGLRELKHLQTIDLRENDLMLSVEDNLTAVTAVLNGLPSLKSVGLCGNWDAADRSL